MPTVPDIHRRGTRADQALASPPFTVGTLWFVTDESVTERWDGATWQSYSGAASAGGTVTHTGTLTANRLLKGNGGVDVTVGDLTGHVTTAGTMATTIAASAVTLAKIANAAANSKLLGSGASGSGAAYSEITLGTNLTMTGTTLDATGGSSGGGWVLLSTQTASASTELDFAAFFSSTYDTYVFVIQGLVLNTSAAQLLIRAGTGGGPTWDTGNNYVYEFCVTIPGGGSPTQVGATAQSSINTMAAGGYKTNAGNAFDGSIMLGNPLGTSLWKKWNVEQSSYQTSSFDNYFTTSGTGWYIATTAVTGVRFFTSSGNFTSGVIRLYGVTK